MLSFYDWITHCLQIGLLHKQLENVQTDQQQLISKYEQQLQKVREEVLIRVLILIKTGRKSKLTTQTFAEATQH